MACTVTRPNKTPKAVTNLGWLLRYARQHLIASIALFEREEGSADMVVVFEDGTVYQADWASFFLARTWVHRPVLRGAPLHIYWLSGSYVQTVA